MTRDDWSKRPLAERKIAAQAWCDGWRDAVEAWPDVQKFSLNSQNVIDHFALDLHDVPAQDERVGPMPWRLQIAAMLKAGDFACSHPDKVLCENKLLLDVADALLAAAQERP